MLATKSIFRRFILPMVSSLLIPGLAIAQDSNDPDFGAHPNPEEVWNVVEANREKMRGCFKTDPQLEPDPLRQLDVQFTIWKDGSVNWAVITSKVEDPEVERCIRDVILLMKFSPLKTDIAKIRYPILFEGSTSNGPYVPTPIVRRVLVEQNEAIQRCYEHDLTDVSNLQGGMSLQFIIEGDGAVKFPRVKKSSLNSTELERCVLGVISKIQFPLSRTRSMTVHLAYVVKLGDKVRKAEVGISDLKVENAFLEKSEIREVVLQHSGVFKECFTKEHETNPDLKGSVTLRFQIDLDGSVSRIRVRSTVANKAVEDCLVGVLEKLTFPKPKGGVALVEYPFVFNSDSTD